EDRIGIATEVGNVLPAFQAYRRERARSDPEIIRARPVSAIVRRSKTWPRVIRGLVMFVAGSLQDRHRHLKELRVGVRILPKLAARVPQEKLRVFFVGEGVGGNVVG